MNLSKNLTLEEVIKSHTATRLGIYNVPTGEELNNLVLLAKNLFQPLRDYFGTQIFISSGYRSRSLNRAIGGAKNSHHCKGQAIDIDQDGKNTSVTNKQIFHYIKDNMLFTQLIYEFGDANNPDWVHVSYDHKNLKREILVSVKEKGKTKYYPYK